MHPVGNSRPLLLEAFLQRLEPTDVFRRFNLGAELQCYLLASHLVYHRQLSPQLCALFSGGSLPIGFATMGCHVRLSETKITHFVMSFVGGLVALAAAFFGWALLFMALCWFLLSMGPCWAVPHLPWAGTKRRVAMDTGILGKGNKSCAQWGTKDRWG